MSGDAARLRAMLDGANGAVTIVGGVGGCEAILRRVLDRLDELEWIVRMMREQSTTTRKED